MPRPPLGRLVLFAALCALLLAAALGFAGGRPGEATPPAVPAPAARVQPLPAAARRIERRAARLEAALRRAARPFLAGFLRYEAGADGPALAGELRASATPAFAARLLAAPPRSPSPASDPPPARLGAIQVTFLSARADRALLRAGAERGGAEEQLSFVFECRGGRWLAAAPGQ
ncbi:MAG TPA: hypothetical protein VFI09_09870 [Solirubrobacterales bacterium]|nr:hypothetical protein [Solirubrobacterales bacterium]